MRRKTVRELTLYAKDALKNGDVVIHLVSLDGVDYSAALVCQVENEEGV